MEQEIVKLKALLDDALIENARLKNLIYWCWDNTFVKPEILENTETQRHRDKYKAVIDVVSEVQKQKYRYEP